MWCYTPLSRFSRQRFVLVWQYTGYFSREPSGPTFVLNWIKNYWSRWNRWDETLNNLQMHIDLDKVQQEFSVIILVWFHSQNNFRKEPSMNVSLLTLPRAGAVGLFSEAFQERPMQWKTFQRRLLRHVAQHSLHMHSSPSLKARRAVLAIVPDLTQQSVVRTKRCQEIPSN